MHQEKQRYFYRKKHKLKSRKTIELLFKEGEYFSVFPYRIYFLQQTVPGLVAGVGVRAKFFKRAVDRNRIKRLMREAWRLNKTELENLVEANNIGLAVFMLYIGNELPEFDTILVRTRTCINRLLKITGESNKNNT